MTEEKQAGEPIRLLLLGRGRMGRAIGQLAPARGFAIGGMLDSQSNAGGAGCSREALEGIDVVVDFTRPEAALENIRRVAAAGKRMVVGTTGWHDRLAEARRAVESGGAGLVYAANFSLGVQLFYRLAQQAAELLAGWTQYEPYLLETHHRFKRDAPSGTARELARRIGPLLDGRMPAIQSVRAGYVPGTHELGFETEGETLLLRHAARTRQAFAEGALVAARWAATHKGFWQFSDILDQEARQ